MKVAGIRLVNSGNSLLLPPTHLIIGAADGSEGVGAGARLATGVARSGRNGARFVVRLTGELEIAAVDRDAIKRSSNTYLHVREFSAILFSTSISRYQNRRCAHNIKAPNNGGDQRCGQLPRRQRDARPRCAALCTSLTSHLSRGATRLRCRRKVTPATARPTRPTHPDV